MCGICCIITRASQSKTHLLAKHEQRLRELLKKRGPDASYEKVITFADHIVTLSSHILWTQGLNVEEQPMSDGDEESKLFVFNGDIYSFPCDDTSSSLLPQENDGVQLFRLITNCVNDNEFIHLISKLQGPFAFILVEKYKKKIWFGRDFFGRSSLVLTILPGVDDDDISLVLSSVAPISELGNVCEIPSAGIFCLSLEKDYYELTLHPWNVRHSRKDLEENINKFVTFLESKLLNIKINFQNEIKVNCVATKLKNFQEERFNSSNNVGQIQDDCPVREISDIISNKTTVKCDDSEMLLKVKNILTANNNVVATFLCHLRKAVKLRVDMKPSFCKTCIAKKIQDSKNNFQCCDHAKIAVLFSGGLDSTVLAYLIAEILDPGETLDLINVAFASDEKQNFTNVPDRQTGLQSYQSLQQIFKSSRVHINFVEANITKSEVEKFRQEYILDLVSPLQSVLDDSIGCCLWFASRGKGIIRNIGEENEDFISYSSPARILFVGSGADELLGGYSRHRSAFEVRGWRGLLDELQQDIDRISMRNLGRDNRIITNHGVCPRMPFLDENVVHFITQECELWVKCCPILPRGIGEKLLLRATAVQLFGDKNVGLALFHKRAIQFGSRLAKLENAKEKGGDICQRLKVLNP